MSNFIMRRDGTVALLAAALLGWCAFLWLWLQGVTQWEVGYGFQIGAAVAAFSGAAVAVIRRWNHTAAYAAVGASLYLVPAAPAMLAWVHQPIAALIYPVWLLWLAAGVVGLRAVRTQDTRGLAVAAGLSFVGLLAGEVMLFSITTFAALLSVVAFSCEAIRIRQSQ